MQCGVQNKVQICYCTYLRTYVVAQAPSTSREKLRNGNLVGGWSQDTYLDMKYKQ